MNKLANWLLLFAVLATVVLGTAWVSRASSKGNYALSNEERLSLKLARAEAANAQIQWNQANDTLTKKMQSFFAVCDQIKASRSLPKEAHCDINDEEPSLKPPPPTGPPVLPAPAGTRPIQTPKQ